MTIRKSFTLVFAAAFLALAPGLRADQPAVREKPPEPDAPRPFKIPAPTRFSLPNGLKVSLVPYGTVPKALVRLTVHVGNADDPAGQTWMADLTGDLLLEGTKTRSATRIAQDAASMGGEVAVQAGENLTTVGGEVLSEFAPAMVDLVADVVRNPAFPEAELARLKANLERRLSIAKSQSQQMAAEAFRAAMYPGQPYGRLFPAPDALKGYTLANAKAFWAGHFGADRSALYVVGVFDAKATEAAIRKAFDGWGKAAAAAAPAPKPSAKRTLTVLDRPGASQSTVILGMPVVDPSSPDYVPLVVTNALLGGSFGSRITSNIREQKGYTYSPFSQVSVRRQGAYWAETADVTTNVTGASIKEIFGEIDRLRAEPPSAAELKGIQNYLAGTFVLQNSSRIGIANQLQFLALHGLPDSYLSGFVSRVHAVTPDEVTRIAKAYIRPEQTTLVVVGDRKTIDDQLKPYAPPAQP
ncbi:MAG TPA: pitrilysin family protein [Thermoanaerobaculia bacterium]|nr:pitrilysin family protein [Thermoanaerobaculia bacterium]